MGHDESIQSQPNSILFTFIRCVCIRRVQPMDSGCLYPVGAPVPRMGHLYPIGAPAWSQAFGCARRSPGHRDESRRLSEPPPRCAFQ